MKDFATVNLWIFPFLESELKSIKGSLPSPNPSFWWDPLLIQFTLLRFSHTLTLLQGWWILWYNTGKWYGSSSRLFFESTPCIYALKNNLTKMQHSYAELCSWTISQRKHIFWIAICTIPKGMFVCTCNCMACFCIQKEWRSMRLISCKSTSSKLFWRPFWHCSKWCERQCDVAHFHSTLKHQKTKSHIGGTNTTAFSHLLTSFKGNRQPYPMMVLFQFI